MAERFDLAKFDPRSVNPEAQLLELDRVDFEESLYKFLRASWRIFDSAPWVDGWCVEAIAEHLQAVVDGEIKRLIINIPPRCQKPVDCGAWIPTLERGLIRLGDIFPGLHVLTHKGRFRKVLSVHDQGHIPTLRLTTRHGRSVVAAPDHPFLTPNGWRQLKNISHQDVVGTIPQYIPSGAKTISAECARLLGYLVGDGCCRGTPNITCADDIEAADIRHCIESVGFRYTDQAYRMANTGYLLRRITIKSDGLDSMPNRRKKGFRGPVRTFLHRHGLDRQTSYTKLVPTAVMEGDDEIARNFIAGYWACDGYVGTKGAKRDGTERDDLLIGCDSVNEEFLRRMQVLLLRLGVSTILRKKVVKMKTKKQGDTYTSYSLFISDQDNCWRFACLVDMRHAKGAKLAAARKRRFDFDQIVRGEVATEISDAGTSACRCLTVEEDESFVANGFAVHNSSLCSVAFPAWVWAQRENTHTSGPGVSFMYASFKDSLSLRDSRHCRKVIESKWYVDRWGARFKLEEDQNTKERFVNDQGGYRLITSVDAKGATGDGANVIVIDDGNSAREVESEATTDSTIDWLDGTLGTRLNNQKLGAIIEIQQRVGERDVTGHLLSKNKGEWTTLVLPMRFEAWRKSYVTPIGWSDPRTEEGELLWPERFGDEEVKALEVWMGPWRACGQLQQRPEPKGGGLIQRDWWKLWARDSFPPMDYIIACLDTAYTEDRLNDPSGMIVWGIFSGDANASTTRIVGPDGELMRPNATYSEFAPRVMLMWAWTEHLALHQLVEKVADSCIRMKVDTLLIENKSAGISVAQEIRRLYSRERFGVQLFDPKNQDKAARLVSVQHLFAEGVIYAPDRAWVEQVITQVAQFPKGAHDEFVDLTSMGLRKLRDMGLLVRQPEREAEIEADKAYRGRDEPLYTA